MRSKPAVAPAEGRWRCRLMDTRKPGHPHTAYNDSSSPIRTAGKSWTSPAGPGSPEVDRAGPVGPECRQESQHGDARCLGAGEHLAPLLAERLVGQWAKTARNGAKMATWEGICYVGENSVTPLSLKC